ncbi:hypothetical protein F4X86_00685 [Candidatus Saccharibacteria bacterium]|nr:hypothetical protein [Candidatus Saccharibacteria bacterium]
MGTWLLADDQNVSAWQSTGGLGNQECTDPESWSITSSTSQTPAPFINPTVSYQDQSTTTYVDADGPDDILGTADDNASKTIVSTITRTRTLPSVYFPAVTISQSMVENAIRNANADSHKSLLAVHGGSQAASLNIDFSNLPVTSGYHSQSLTTTAAGATPKIVGSRLTAGTGTLSLAANDSTNYATANGFIQAYDWEVDWELTITLHDSRDYITWLAFPDYDTTNSNPGWYYDLTQTRNFYRSVTFTGTYETCSRSLYALLPGCYIKMRDYNSATHTASTGQTLPDNGIPGAGAGKIENVPGFGAQRILPVGPLGHARVVWRGHNAYEIRNNSSYFTIISDGSTFRNNSVSVTNSTINNDTGATGYDWYGSSFGIVHSVYRSYMSTGNTDIRLPGQYILTWYPNWITAASGWGGGQLTGSQCAYDTDGYNSTPILYNNLVTTPADGQVVSSLSLRIFIGAEPPTCRVDYLVQERSHPENHVKVTLTNPNHAPMDADFLQYTINRPSSSPPDNQVGTLSSTIIPSVGSITLRSPYQPIGEDGVYDYSWKMQTSMGRESWTTLGDISGLTQNSWFEDPNERIHEAGNPCEDDLRIVVKPYVKVFHGDVGVGGHFGKTEEFNPCETGNTEIIYNSAGSVDGFIVGHSSGSNSSDTRGSSVRHGSRAYNEIANFYSASQRTSTPEPLKGLSFSNTNFHLDYGGDFGKANCMTNYWRETGDMIEEPNPGGTPPVPINIDLSNIVRNNDRKRWVLNSNQNLNISSSGNLADLKATLFVEGEGDVYINSDIINENATGWRDRSEIGYLLIVVRGNIYIDPSVNRIDAVLVAHPRQDANSWAVEGEIWTCHNSSITAANHYASCNSDLVVNGALIAQRVRFGRINNSVIEAVGIPENDTRNATEINNKLSGLPSSRNRASEEINLRPEFLIGIPELPLFPDQLYKSDSITVTPVNY